MLTAEGTIIDNRYRLEHVLGEGGMGCVWAATQLDVSRRVAVKVLQPDKVDSEQARSRFMREAAALATLRHPHIVGLLDFGQADDGAAYMVMELAEGPDLSTIIAEQSPLDPARVRRIAKQLASALKSAHDAGVVHRDIKPSNIIIGELDGDEFVHLLDFGIAKSFIGIGGAGVDVTATHDIIGSPRYMSPEQAQGQPVTPASDVYAFGLVLYEMLTGQPAFDSESAGALIVAHATEPVEPPECEDETLANLALWCLQKAPWDRPVNAAIVMDTLNGGAIPAFGEEVDDSDLAIPRDGPLRGGGSRPVLWGMLAAVLLVTVGLVAWQVSSGSSGRVDAPAAPKKEAREVSEQEPKPAAPPAEHPPPAAAPKVAKTEPAKPPEAESKPVKPEPVAPVVKDGEKGHNEADEAAPDKPAGKTTSQPPRRPTPKKRKRKPRAKAAPKPAAPVVKEPATPKPVAKPPTPKKKFEYVDD